MKTTATKFLAYLEEATECSYSWDRYTRGGWRNALKGLHTRGFSTEQIIIIMNSKVPRWAADRSDQSYGRVSGAVILEFVDNSKLSPSPFTFNLYFGL